MCFMLFQGEKSRYCNHQALSCDGVRALVFLNKENY